MVSHCFQCHISVLIRRKYVEKIYVLLCKAVWYYYSFVVIMCLGVNLLHLCMHKFHVLQYTTAHLQVLFSSQHLGGITKVLQ